MRKNLLLDAIAIFGVLVPVAWLGNEIGETFSLTWLFRAGAIAASLSGLWIIGRLEHLNSIEAKQNA